MRRPPALALLLGGGLLLALVQQLVLQRRPPRLLGLQSGGPSSGPGAVDLRFSRAMAAGSLAAASRLSPPLPHQWLGQDNPLRLLLNPGQRLHSALALELAGRDRRGLALAPQRWFWDPRPRLLAVVPVGQGEQLQLQGNDGRWRPLTPVLPRILTVQPLGDGAGVALVSGRGDDPAGEGQDLWLLPLQQHNLSQAPLQEPSLGRMERLNRGPLIFAHLSSNRRGDLLVQSSSRSEPAGSTWLRDRSGRRRPLPQRASGPMQLLPEGGALVVPEPEGLSLQALPGLPARRQLLPGSRDLSGFCPVSGRALLVRHWPDFRRSLELVEPGVAPRQLWIGPQALAATACSRGGERIWALLIEGVGRPALTLVTLDRRGSVLASRRLAGWELEPGTGLSYDPTSDRLAMVLRPLGDRPGAPPAAPRAVLIEASSLTLQPLPQEALQAIWLPAG